MVQFQAEHNFNRQSREAVYGFLAEAVSAGVRVSEKVVERGVEVEPLLDMLVWEGRSLPPNALSAAQLFEEWQMSGRKRVAALDGTARRELLLDVFHAAWPRDVRSEGQGREHHAQPDRTR